VEQVTFNFAEESVVPILEASTIELLVDQTLSLDASDTYVNNSNTPKEGYTFSWICPNSMPTPCEGITTSTLQIPYSSYTGPYNTKQTFTVVVSWDHLGEITNFTSSVAVNMTNVKKPAFSIQPVGSILATVDSQINLVISNFDPPYDALMTTWSLIPNATASFVQSTKSSLSLQAGALETLTDYLLTVKVTNPLSPLAFTTATYSFRTDMPPVEGQVFSDPQSGEYPTTEFTVYIRNWNSLNPPVKYRVWSSSDSEGQTRNQLLSNSWLAHDQNYTLFLPNTNPLIIELSDDSGEVTYRPLNIQLTVEQQQSQFLMIKTLQ